tara:strand:- start:491 stop:1018 length:528 start_codon:yes stop_codon:yes gene_type:complete
MSSELRVDKIIPTNGVPTGGGGGIVQVASTTKTDTFVTTSTSFVDITGLSVSITPKFSTSKILVTYHTNASMEDDGYRGGLRLMRDSTAIFVGDSAGSRPQLSNHLVEATGTQQQFSYSGQTLDSPATTSAVTYKVQAISLDSGRQININKSYGDSNDALNGRTASSITVMEVSV